MVDQKAGVFFTESIYDGQRDGSIAFIFIALASLLLNALRLPSVAEFFGRPATGSRFLLPLRFPFLDLYLVKSGDHFGVCYNLAV